DLLEYGELVFTVRSGGNSTLGLLTEWRQVNLFLALRGRLQHLYAAQYAAEVTAGMVEEADPHPALFDALVRFLEDLSAGSEPLPLLAGYQTVLLREVGLWPDLTRCVLC